MAARNKQTMTENQNPILIRAAGITKSYGGRMILQIGELTVRQGDSIALTGDNGSGKTTLLKILAGLIKPDSAKMLQFGDGTTPYPQGAPMVSYLHQTPHLFAATVRANIEYGLHRIGLNKEERTARVAEAMQWANIQHLAETRADKLSGGEQRRTALARIRALTPKLYLLDEPTAHLDAESTTRTAQMIRTLQTQNENTKLPKATIITACHPPLINNIPTTRQWHLKTKTLTEQ